MTEMSAEKANGIRIKSLNHLFIGFTILFVILFLIVARQIMIEYEELSNNTDAYVAAQNDAMQVQSSSDYLTQQVNLFVMTGERRYMNLYFNEYLVTKRREIALEDIRAHTPDEKLINSIDEAVNESMRLMQLEFHAFHLASIGYGLEEDSLPDDVKNYALTEEELALSAKEKIQLAREIVFGSDYRLAKDTIYGYLGTLFNKVKNDTAQVKEFHNRRLQSLLGSQGLSAALLFLMCALLFAMISRWIVLPLSHAVDAIEQGKDIQPITGTYEIQFMENTYNRIHHNNEKAREVLLRDAHYDQLTGLFNRRSYDETTANLRTSDKPMAFLLLDIDKFKNINDEYGHEIGDDVLKKVASLLSSTFRTDDFPSRYGGDEFTVILMNMKRENQNILTRKIQWINDALANAEDGLPAASVSVGCAFSEAGFHDTLLEEADNMLYKQKNIGGCGISYSDKKIS